MKANYNFLATLMALVWAIACLVLGDAANALQLTNEFWICNNTNTSGLGTLADPFDGSTAVKFDNIMSNLSTYCVMHILAGTYQTAGTAAWNPKSGQKFLGSGMNVTTLHLLAGSPGSTHVICTFNTSYSPGQDTNTEVADLTIDLAGSTNVHGVNLFGYSHVIRRVKVINATSTVGNECFPIQIASYAAPNSSERNIIEGCVVSNLNVDQCSAICFSGGSGSNWMSGEIRNNQVFLSNAETPGGSTVQYAFNVGGVRNLLFEGNYVNNASTALEIANAAVTNFIIANNTFKNCDSGFGCSGGPLQNITFCFNTVELSSNGYGGALSTDPSTTSTNFIIMGNTFKFNDVLGSSKSLISASTITGLVVVNNSIDGSMTNSIVGCTGVNFYNNVDLFGNAYTNSNQVKPPDGIVRTSISGNYAASYADRYIGCKVTPCTITLPPAAGYSGKEYIIADEIGSGAITLTPTSGDLINGLTSYSYHGSYVTRTIISDGSNWYARKR